MNERIGREKSERGRKEGEGNVRGQWFEGGWKKGVDRVSAETITPLLRLHVINDSIVGELFIYHRSGSSSCPLNDHGVWTSLSETRSAKY